MKEQTEYFFVGERFYHNLDELLEDLAIETIGDVDELENDFRVECFESVLEKPIKFNLDWIIDRIPEERFAEDDNATNEKIIAPFKHIDFDKINNEMPSFYYPTRNKFFIVKEDIINYLKK